MLFKKKVKAGVLLYALLMASIFTLILQFYLHRVVASERLLLVQTQQAKASLVAELTKDLATDKEGQFQFSEGRSHYQEKSGLLEVTVMIGERAYAYHYLKPDIEEKAEDKGKSDGKEKEDEKMEEVGSETEGSSSEQESELSHKTAKT